MTGTRDAYTGVRVDGRSVEIISVRVRITDSVFAGTSQIGKLDNFLNFKPNAQSAVPNSSAEKFESTRF